MTVSFRSRLLSTDVLVEKATVVAGVRSSAGNPGDW
jgi:hypothetical protein